MRPDRVPALLKSPRFWVALILLLALALRLAHVLAYPFDPDISGGDYSWFAREGQALVNTGRTDGPPPTGPLFLLIAGYAGKIGPAIFPEGPASDQAVIRLWHAFLGTLTVLMVYRIGRAAWSEGAGALAAALLAVNPAFIVEAGNLATETTAIFLLTWALALWMERAARPDRRLMLATGALLALGALTRAVLLALPALLLVDLLLRHGLRRAVGHGAVLLLAFFLTIFPWTLYNLVVWDRLTLTGEGLTAMLYIGATGWQDPDKVDAGLGLDPAAADPAIRQQAYLDGFRQTVFGDPVGYARQRIGELAGALLQPHNTNFYPGQSLKALALDWLQADRSPGGLLRLTQAEQFWPKLLLYVFHYAGLLLGIIGLVLNLRRWRALWPLYGLFLYFLGIHLALSAIPRYLFPLEAFWWLFGAAALSRFFRRGPAPGREPGLAAATPSRLQ